MTQIDVLAQVVKALDDAGIPHMVVGSFASTFHGDPRMTRDVDVVIDPTPRSIEVLIGELDRGWLYSTDAREALRRQSMFNVIDPRSGWKVDLIIRRDRPFSRMEFSRRIPAEISGVGTFVASVEDTILSKLEWHHQSESERQMDDAVAMIIVQSETLDNAYLNHWAQQIGVTAELRSARDSAAQADPRTH